MRSYLLRYEEPPIYSFLTFIFILSPTILINWAASFLTNQYLYNSLHLFFKLSVILLISIFIVDSTKINPLFKAISFIACLGLFIFLGVTLNWLTINELVGSLILLCSTSLYCLKKHLKWKKINNKKTYD